MRIGAFLPEPFPGQAWIRTSAEFWEWAWELGAVGASPGRGGKVHSTSLSRYGLVSCHPVLCGLTKSWNTALWKLTWFAFCRAPKVKDLGSMWLSTLEETVLPQG